MIQVSQQAVKYFTLLVDQQVFQGGLLLLVEELLHDLEEVAAQDWERVFILVKEGTKSVHKAIVFLGEWLLCRLVGLLLLDGVLHLDLVIIFILDFSGRRSVLTTKRCLVCILNVLLETNLRKFRSLLLILVLIIVIKVKLWVQVINQLFYLVTAAPLNQIIHVQLARMKIRSKELYE